MYIAVGTAGTLGSATGLAAVHAGMDPVHAATLGSTVSAATGDLLRQLLGVSKHDMPNPPAPSAVTAETTANISSSSLAALQGATPPLQPPAVTGPMLARQAHHGRHRQLQRSARRRSQRAAVRVAREGGGRGPA
ncbi:hypothetical protein [Streptomyces sp. NPDC002952]|uniref:hypothetical protein n=1 Tax=Streptomyces sp. NPDC002952 TaxID=3364673 RepID=UPI00368EAC86